MLHNAKKMYRKHGVRFFAAIFAVLFFISAVGAVVLTGMSSKASDGLTYYSDEQLEDWGFTVISADSTEALEPGFYVLPLKGDGNPTSSIMIRRDVRTFETCAVMDLDESEDEEELVEIPDAVEFRFEGTINWYVQWTNTPCVMHHNENPVDAEFNSPDYALGDDGFQWRTYFSSSELATTQRMMGNLHANVNYDATGQSLLFYVGSSYAEACESNNYLVPGCASYKPAS